MIMFSDECHRTLLMISQHWFRWWLGAVRQQAITWANVDLVPCRHMASPGHNMFIKCGGIIGYSKITIMEYGKFMIVNWTSLKRCGKSKKSTNLQHFWDSFYKSYSFWILRETTLMGSTMAGNIQRTRPYTIYIYQSRVWKLPVSKYLMGWVDTNLTRHRQI